ncbi:hypothetical protein Tfer_2113 [Thermincola ferriacetica]|uniref:Uncharacterized protein n=1 Tax=Thermincola ferriacetica TaxID=281456 RepID=A0A0L6W1G3_9FIRM|nr:hypothetical protein [Thermincola ferriacetica]KNZ69316.1 hypothetical protein Tfer_2113 [Thermincola ferriacetica]
MISSAVLDSYYDNVVSSIELLANSVLEYKLSLRKSIAECAMKKEIDTDEIRKLLDQEDRIKTFLSQVEELKFSWDSAIQGGGNFNTSMDNYDGKDEYEGNKDVSARTSWRVAGDSIKIETKRQDAPPYSNVFPILLFKEIALMGLDFIERNGSVKTTDVVNVLENKIIATSDYKKTPRIPVYATFKVLVKEQKFKIDEHNSHKYLLAVPKDKFKSWIDQI